MKISSSTILTTGLLLSFGTTHAANNNKKGGLRRRTTEGGRLLAEDEAFFTRLLQGDSSMPPVPRPTAPPTLPAATDPPVARPTDAPVAPPTDAPVAPPTDAPVTPPTDAPVVPPTDAPVVPPTDAPVVSPTEPPVVDPTEAPVAPPTDAPVSPPTMPPTDPPAECPVTLAIDCISTDGTPCEDLTAPESGSGAECEVDVEYTYSFSNESDDAEQIYSLSVIRNGVTTDITGDIGPETVLSPGQSLSTPPLMDTIDLCAGERVNTQAFLFTGPPIDVSISVDCVSEEGDDCAAIREVGTDGECLIDITYTYTITNTGFADTEFVVLNRVRNGETVDLLPLLDSNVLAVGESTSVTETEEIDRCVTQDFTTSTQVIQSPSLDNLCEDTAFFP